MGDILSVMSGTGRFALVVLLLIVLNRLAALIRHKRHLLFIIHMTHRDAGDAFIRRWCCG